ncbi:MAG TPA: protein kinase [Polyangia bacterium]|nr:protein kinase [Polyangia bacterium]
MTRSKERPPILPNTGPTGRVSSGNPGSSTARTAIVQPPQFDPAILLNVKELTSKLPTVERDNYEVEGECARGGLGRILQARDVRLERTVAIKELLATTERAAARFVREALVSARLQHPAIVPVYEAGRWPNGELFYTMKMISGRSLKEAIEETKTLDERLALLPNVISVADAMAYAHDQRIIHRDLKPANILIGPFGETVVIDWGLAKDLTKPQEEPESIETAPLYLKGNDLTIAGAVMGTPQYMPPEQARGEAVDERADVYTLGAVLYHLLAGVSPYEGETASDILSSVLRQPPTSLEERQPGIPQDLVTIVSKAMAYRKEDRYPSARELAEDLRRFQTGQLVSAHEYSSLTLLKRWLRRYRAPVTVALGCLLLLLIGGVVGVRRIVVARNQAEKERARAESQSNELLLVEARASLERDPTTALAWLKNYPLSAPGWEKVRDIALDAWSRGAARHVFRRDESTSTFGAFSPDGRLFAGASEGKVIRLWDIETGHTVKSLPYQVDLEAVTFTPDGRTVAFAEWNIPVVKLWDTMSGKVRALPAQAGVLTALAISPDGRWLASGGSDHKLWLWSLDSDEHRVVEGFAAYEGALILEAVRFSPDSRWLAFPGADNTVRLWEVATGKTRILTGRHQDTILTLAFSRDGKYLVSGSKDRSVRLWEMASGEERLLGLQDGSVRVVQFSPSGQLVASGGQDRSVRVWHTSTGEGRILGTHRSQIETLAFSPDGQLLAVAGTDTTVQLWQVAVGEKWELQGHVNDVSQVLFSPDGRYLASMSDDHTVRLWDTSIIQGRVLRGHEDDIRRILFSPDGKTLATASRDRTVRLWDVQTGKMAHVLRGHEAMVYNAAFSPHGEVLASAGFDGALRLWNVATEEVRKLPGHKGPLRALEFSPDGKQLATCGDDGVVRLWDVQSGIGRALGTHQGRISWLVFSPDGALLASAGDDHLIKLWSVANGAQRVLAGHTDQVFRVAFSHNGQYLASSSLDNTVRLWNVAAGTGRILGTHKAQGGPVAFSGDDRYLASGAIDGSLQLWDLVTGASSPLPGHTARILALAFSPTAALLASASVDHTVRLWDINTGTCQRFFRHENYVEDVAFSPDGRTLVSCSVDKTIRLWPVSHTKRLPEDPAGLQKWMGDLTSAEIQPGRELGTP